MSVGGLTKQKNFIFLCKAFKKIVKEHSDIKLLIAGEGEQRTELSNFIKENNLSKNIILLGFIENIFPYFKNSNGFILTSLWEDPGFVLVEAAFCRAPILYLILGQAQSNLLKKILTDYYLIIMICKVF